MSCCPTLIYPCKAGNSIQTYTKTCEIYYKEQRAATASVPANTIFTDCAAKSNEIARELAEYEANQLTHCMGCCSRSICVYLDNPADALNFDYFSVELGVRVHTNTRICLQVVDECDPPPFPFDTFVVRFNELNAAANGGCVELEAGVVYNFRLSPVSSTNFEAPEEFAIGWNCNTPCPVDDPIDSVVTFPMGIAQCTGGF